MFFGFFSTFLFYILLVETQDKKTMGNKTLKITMTEKKKKKKFQGFCVFDFGLYLTWKTWKSRKVFVYFRLLFGSIRNSKSKNQKNDFKQKIVTLRLGLIRKNENFGSFPSFRFCPTPKIENPEVSESFLLLQF